ncbi:hypothetical protein D9619_010926 [Psilocybe cf. subviscida]|uniref:Uncharacterized protein n=1 Tax=Psilocybe cf. subviscida TaxID=2480587 RepID=A0A8H5B7V4_9AGAR|nr:hypothetical protein D9619_010926 [Psilocybe cf. subviscida]
MSGQHRENDAESSASGLARTGAPASAQRVGEANTARAQPPTHHRRTLDGYQVPAPRADPPPPRNPNALRTVKTAGHAGAGNQHQPSVISASGGVGGAGVIVAPNAGRGGGGIGARPAGRFDASRRPQPIRSASTLSGSSAFPPPIPRRDLMRFQRQAQQADRASRKGVASSSAGQLRANVGQTLRGMFAPPATIQKRRIESPRQPPNQPLPTATSQPGVLKTGSPFKPLRQVIEEERIEDIMKYRKQANVIRPQRIGGRSTAAEPRAIPPHPSLPKAYIDERKRFRIEGEDSDTMDVDEDEDEDENIGTQQAKKSSANPVKLVLAARKRDMVPASSSESEPSSDDDSKSTSSGPTLEYVSDVEDRRPAAEASDDDDIYATEEEVIPDIIFLDDPRQAPPSALVGSAEPPPEMLAAAEAVLQPTLRLQRARRLPFLLKPLRVGFLQRCRERRVPSYSSGRRVFFSVHYMYTDGALYVTKVDSWRCPLCSLMGVMPTRQMLECHLKWDHPELFYEWRKLLETQEEESWEVEIVIPELVQPAYVPPRTANRSAQDEQSQPRVHISPSKTETTPQPRQMAPTRAVSTSASTTTIASSLREPSTTLSLPDTLDDDVKPTIRDAPASRPRDDRSVTASGQSATATTSERPSLRSTTASTVVQRLNQPHPRNALPVVPPPADDPLGPAARPPYLPAESDYGGPTVYYSCRPGGACLFDLLGTLPMEPYGVLDWEVADREEEIWESDDVRDEYKVMQALWSRWIMLNRNRFVANYYKGIIAFVDQYWKFIHKAAGWAALRYWLFTLLANDFLTTREVAKTLIHYEGLTGMAQWYNTP